MKQLDYVIAIGLAVLLTSYALQAILSILNAARPVDRNPRPSTEPESKDQSLLSRAFKGIPQITSTWATIGIVFILPIGIAWLASLSSVSLDFDLGLFIYSGSLSTFIVLLTLELSQLNDLKPRNRSEWRALLLVAVALDLGSLLLLVWPIKLRTYETDHHNWSSVRTQIILLTIGALISGALVVLFAKKAGED